MPFDATFDWDAARYQDTGCQVSSSCLSCPLAQCIEDDPNPWLAVQRWRNAEIARLAAQGKDRDGLAASFNISRRRIEAILLEARRR